MFRRCLHCVILSSQRGLLTREGETAPFLFAPRPLPGARPPPVAPSWPTAAGSGEWGVRTAPPPPPRVFRFCVFCTVVTDSMIRSDIWRFPRTRAPCRTAMLFSQCRSHVYDPWKFVVLCFQSDGLVISKKSQNGDKRRRTDALVRGVPELLQQDRE